MKKLIYIMLCKELSLLTLIIKIIVPQIQDRKLNKNLFILNSYLEFLIQNMYFLI